MSDLFAAAGLGRDLSRPLADRLRPDRLEAVVGQDHLLAAEAPLGRMIESGVLNSLILWGPPGVGKTTIARLLADAVGLRFEALSAVFSGVKDLRAAFDRAEAARDTGQATLLFVDEIHRFNRAQQDSFLPFVEQGTVVLVGATTENPSFEVIGALLSRCKVLTLNPLDHEALGQLLVRAEEELATPLPLTEGARAELVRYAAGDGRYLLGLVEDVARSKATLDVADLALVVQRRFASHDKDRDGHYNLISALHKAVRGSDPDAALYWFARMLDGGEDPHYIARRVVRMASEDIGLADPTGLMIAGEAARSYERLGSPEGELAIAHAIVHLATAPKSNAVYVAYKAARAAAKDSRSLPPPKHILNAPTDLMKAEGYGAGYAYDHDAPGGVSGQNYFPDDMARQRFYTPTDRGREKAIGERLVAISRLRDQTDNG